MAHTWDDPTGATVTIYSVDGSAGIMTLTNIDDEGTQLLLGLDVEKCEITFSIDWTSGAAGSIVPRVYYRAAADLSTFFRVDFSVLLDPLTVDEIVAIVLRSEVGIIETTTVSKEKTPGVPFNVKIRSTLNHYVKVWSADVAEPDDWDVTVAGSGSTASGTVGLAGFVGLDAPTPDPLDPFYMLGYEAATVTNAANPPGSTRQMGITTGNITISSAGQGRDGVGYAGVFAPTAGVDASIEIQEGIPASLTQGSFTFYFIFPSSLPVAGRTGLWECIVTTANNRPYVQFRASDNRVVFIANSAGGATTGLVAGPVITAGVWYRVDIGYSNATGSQVWQWSVDGVAQTNVTFVTAGTDLVTIVNGHVTADAGSATATFRMDDVFYTASSADYPIGGIAIQGLIPDPAGTLTISGTADSLARFRADGGLLDSTFVSADNLVALSSFATPPPSGGVDGTYQRTSGATNFVNVPMETYTLGPGEGFGGVQLELIGWESSAGGTNNFQMLANAGAGNVLLFSGNPAWNPSTNWGWARLIFTPSGNWDQTKLDAFTVVFGGSTDLAPLPGINYCFAELAIRTSDSGAAVIDLEFDDFQVCSCEEA